jgi:hypothetical protein
LSLVPSAADKSRTREGGNDCAEITVPSKHEMNKNPATRLTGWRWLFIELLHNPQNNRGVIGLESVEASCHERLEFVREYTPSFRKRLGGRSNFYFRSKP